jgi:hypothetical protein
MDDNEPKQISECGAHKLDAPISAWKAVQCVVASAVPVHGNGFTTTPCVAKITIPTGATVVTTSPHQNYPKEHRTDQLILDNVRCVNDSSCNIFRVFSIRDIRYTYHKNIVNTPEDRLNMNAGISHGSGLHFFSHECDAVAFHKRP